MIWNCIAFKFLALYLNLRVCFNHFDNCYLFNARQKAFREHNKTLWEWITYEISFFVSLSLKKEQWWECKGSNGQMCLCKTKRFGTSVFSPAKKKGPWATLTGEGSTSRSDWCWIPCALLAGSQLTLLSGEETLIRRTDNESLLLGCQYTNEKKKFKISERFKQRQITVYVGSERKSNWTEIHASKENAGDFIVAKLRYFLKETAVYLSAEF